MENRLPLLPAIIIAGFSEFIQAGVTTLYQFMVCDVSLNQMQNQAISIRLGMQTVSSTDFSEIEVGKAMPR